MTDIPDHIDGYGPVRRLDPARLVRPAASGPRRDKLLPGLAAALDACDLSDGATLSFHHHLRNGDGVLNAVLEAAGQRGLKDLHVAASSIFPVHAPLVDHIRNGTVARITTSFLSGPVGAAVARGDLPTPVVLQTHGGRARALDTGELPVDAAFVAAPAADALGNISGRAGRAACGPLGYPQSDVSAARRVVAVTDCLCPFPAAPLDIAQDKVDFVVALDSIGDPAGIASGTTRPATDATGLQIAADTARVIAASGVLQDGFAFQTGAGGVSLATAQAVGREMHARGITGSFAAGGITGFHVEMLQAGLFTHLMDVQSFDLAAVQSYCSDPRHLAMSAAAYAGPHVGGAIVDRIDAVVLGATEIDLDFNVNVTTRADGTINGGSGGHADIAAGARLSLVTTRLTAAGFAKIVPRVGCLTTPSATIDVVVTEAGIAVNPARPELADRLRTAGLAVTGIAELAAMAGKAATRHAVPRGDGRVLAVSEYRDGTVTDLVRARLP